MVQARAARRLVVVMASALLALPWGGRGTLRSSPQLPAPSHVVDDVTISIANTGTDRDASAVAAAYGIPLDWVLQSTYPCANCDRRGLEDRVSAIHARGQLYLQYVSAGIVYKGGGNLGDLRPDLLAAAALDIDGQPITSTFGAMTTYKMNMNEPAWQEFLRTEIAAAVAAGADGIVLDDIQAQTLAIGWESRGVFNPPDMEGFREFLRGVYTPDVLATRFGIPDLDRFDYGAYIRARGEAGRWRTAPWEVMLYNEFRVFEYQSTLQHYAAMTGWAREIARTTQGKDIVFLGNTSTGLDMSLPFERSLDEAWVEFPYMDFGYPPRCKVMPSAKVTTSGRVKKGTYLTQVPTNTDLVSRGHPPNIAKIFLAEAYAARAEYQVPYEVVGASGNYSPDLRALAPYYQFVATNRSWFGSDWTWTPRAAIFYPVSAYLAGADSYYGAALPLVESGIAFDVVFSGDDRMMPNEAGVEALRRYPVIVLANTVAMTSAQIQIVLEYVRGGGRVVAWGSPGAANEFQDWSVARPAEWRAFWSVGRHPLGTGTFTLVTQEDLGREYFTNRSASAREKMLGPIAEVAPPDMAASAEPVVAIAYRHRTEDRLVVHLVNYDYSLESDTVRDAGPFEVTVRLPVGFDWSGKRVRLLAPDVAEAEPIEVRIERDRATFVVPRLGIYGLVAVDAVPSDARSRHARR